jgi:hypothetical protein
MTAGGLRLYRSDEHPDQLVGEDQHRALVVFPATPKGWARRTPYTGERSKLVEISPALARGTKWPGARGGRVADPSGKPRSRFVAIMATDEQRARWAAAAAERGLTLSQWTREALDAYSAQPRKRRK